MKEYQKIPAVYKRDLLTHKTIPEYISPEVEYLADKKWDFSEKIDGSNHQVHWDGHRIEFGGRTEKAQIPPHLLKFLTEKFATPAMEEVFEQIFGDKDVILFGEGYGYNIQLPHSFKDNNLYLNNEAVGFRVFDVMINGFYVSKANMIDITEKLGIEHVDILGQATLPELIEIMKTHPNSILIKTFTDQDWEMEGFVATPAVPMYNNKGERIIVKIKWQDMKELL